MIVNSITLQVYQCTINFGLYSVVKQMIDSLLFFMLKYLRLRLCQKTNGKKSVMKAVSLGVGESLFSLSRPSTDAEKCRLISA